MKRLLLLLVSLAFLIGQWPAEARTAKHHARRSSTSASDVKGGGYHGGNYHLRKAGEPKKPLLRWEGYHGPIKGMKESAKKPPAKYPSQSPNN